MQPSRSSVCVCVCVCVCEGERGGFVLTAQSVAQTMDFWDEITCISPGELWHYDTGGLMIGLDFEQRISGALHVKESCWQLAESLSKG